MEALHLTGSSNLARANDDFYMTPEWTTKLILAREELKGITREPACGLGAISNLIPGCIATDLIERGYGTGNIDFLETSWKCDNIITNPPYLLAEEFIRHSIKTVTCKVIMLLKLNFLAGQKRKVGLFIEYPPTRIYIISKRVSFDRALTKNKDNGLLEYAWYVWEVGYTGKPTIEWL